MDSRFLVFLLVLGTCCWCCNARVVATDLSPMPAAFAPAPELHINDQQQEMVDGGVDGRVCTMCEVVVAPVLEYLSNSTSETELISALHLLCALTFPFKDKCKAKVDRFVPLFLNQSSELTPEALCAQIGVCHAVVFVSQHLSGNSCAFCHNAVTEAITKLKHPDFQLYLVELLLETCNAVEDSAEECKRLVLANAPLIPVYAKWSLKGLGICNLLPACSSATYAKEPMSSSEPSVHSAAY